MTTHSQNTHSWGAYGNFTPRDGGVARSARPHLFRTVTSKCDVLHQTGRGLRPSALF